MRLLPTFLSKKKFVLVIGDEGAVLTLIQGRTIKDAWFASRDEGPQALLGTLDEDRSAPLLVLCDVLEQMYREETLPPTSFIDRPKVVRRRLDLAFPNEPIKAALPKLGTKAQWMMTSLPNTPVMAPWLQAIEVLERRVVGFCLLPMESLEMIRLLGARTTDPASGKYWRSMISQHITGGFRLIFAQRDQMVVTRLTQRPPEDASAEEIAQSIEREFRSTISYVKRMGYAESDPLDLVVITSNPIREALRKLTLPASEITVLTPQEAGETLGFPCIAPNDTPFGDILHAAWFGQKKNPVLELGTPAMVRRRNLRHTTRWGMGIAAAATLGLSVMAGLSAYDMMEAEAIKDSKQAALRSAQNELKRKRDLIAGFPVPLLQMRGILQAQDSLRQRSVDSVFILKTLAQSFGAEATVSLLNIEANPSPEKAGLGAATATPAAPAPRGAQAKQVQPPILYAVTVTADLLDVANDPEAALKKAYNLLDRLRKAFAGHEVEIVKLPVNVLPGQTLEGGSNKTVLAEQQKGRPMPTAQYMIRKVLRNET
ncbi:MAG: hypothetical protein K2Q10_00325 [Rhodospirillales bacterium]|nr:hypothetical protein [Rhodospirillales bacterium]